LQSLHVISVQGAKYNTPKRYQLTLNIVKYLFHTLTLTDYGANMDYLTSAYLQY